MPKISTLNLRIEPELKEAVREAATREHRSVANMVEMLIRRHCVASGIEIERDFTDDHVTYPEIPNG